MNPVGFKVSNFSWNALHTFSERFPLFKNFSVCCIVISVPQFLLNIKCNHLYKLQRLCSAESDVSTIINVKFGRLEELSTIFYRHRGNL